MNLFKKVILMAGLTLSATAFANDVAPAGSTLIKNPQADYYSKDGQVTVQQFLWNQCIHCYNLEPYVDQWDSINADYITLERIPVAWGERHVKDGSFYNYGKVMKKTGKITDQELVEINNGLFKIAIVDRKEINAETAFPLFEKHGIKSADELQKLVNSFVNNTEINKSKKLTKDFDIAGVPVFVVSGKYLVSFQSLKEATPAELFATLDRIAAAEHEKTKHADVPAVVKEEVKTEVSK